MASYYFGINRGKNMDTAVVGTSTNNTDIEIVVKDTVLTRQSVLTAIKNLQDFMLSTPYPPA